MRIGRLVFAFAALVAMAAPARADLLISVDKSTQQMVVAVDGVPRYFWPVSTGVSGHDTPSGQFKPFRMEEDHFSKEWDDAPMPHSIFFTMQGHAIHGSSHRKALGTPASHGCVRLEPANAAVLFSLVKQQKMANTRVVLTGETPLAAGVPVARRSPPVYQRTYSNDQFADDVTASVPVRRQRTVRTQEYPEAQQYYYDRESPYYRSRRDERRYGYEQQPFGWPFGR
jgi:hypothetical protein